MNRYLHAGALLEAVKPVSTWLGIALDSAYKEIWKAKRKGDKPRLARAERNLARLRAKAKLVAA